MKSISKYKEQICNITKDPEFEKKKFAYGFTSTVYRVGDSVVKETFLSEEELKSQNFFQEIRTNVYFRKHPELEKYVAKFEGFEFCDDKIYTKYEYVGNTLSDTIVDYTPKELTFIKNKVLEIITILHKYVIHGDLHTGNIFIMKGKDGNIENILIGDWGRAIIKDDYLKENGTVEGYNALSKNDLKIFYEDFRQRLEKTYFFKNVKIETCLKLIEKKGKKEFFKTKLDLKMEERKKRFPHRPTYLIEQFRPYFYNVILFNIITKEYGRKFILTKCNFSVPMQKFINSLK
jgi:hypothetical protein